MSFDDEKNAILSRTDLSKKGSIDKSIRPLVDWLNNQKNYVTTSSCAGRIVLLRTTQDFDKKHSNWLFTSHDPVQEDLHPYMSQQGNIWLKQEGAILHLKCRTMKAAEYFLNTAKHAGFKRTGIISVKERPVVELTSSEQIIVPLVNDGVILIDNEHLTTITSLANYSMERNRAKLKKLLHNLQSQ